MKKVVTNKCNKSWAFKQVLSGQLDSHLKKVKTRYTPQTIQRNKLQNIKKPYKYQKKT